MTDDDAPATGAAHVHVVRGTPDDVELAALVAGLAAVGTADDAAPEPARSAWTDRSRTVRGAPRTPVAGPDAWRWSLRG
ncbi:acyl-CoA carboxylase epsilon subunit [Cellulomonas sp. ATA003]|uniref:acyl-CoA carboxylase epsilon subunit n=1 Tax=Cellulomonas sp. ATA003 TaxID=3073064 RepID=UPI002873EE9E|nr:acyl-CoA carboxylase epsilon subunit [Cellulomonas sp. ATA003]WNB84979.1 acyl-CoA carboxylase epsilon subunit [Cellulomonas sp. ATA003]